jgi:hypothetical protein
LINFQAARKFARLGCHIGEGQQQTANVKNSILRAPFNLGEPFHYCGGADVAPEGGYRQLEPDE